MTTAFGMTGAECSGCGLRTCDGRCFDECPEDNAMSQTKLKAWPFFGYAPGAYTVDCLDCGDNFANLDKQAIRCLECAVKAAKTVSVPEDVRESLRIAITALGGVSVRCFDRPESPLKPIGDIAREALANICLTVGGKAYDELSSDDAALTPLPMEGSTDFLKED